MQKSLYHANTLSQTHTLSHVNTHTHAHTHTHTKHTHGLDSKPGILADFNARLDFI